jgi:hypothetical protein
MQRCMHALGESEESDNSKVRLPWDIGLLKAYNAITLLKPNVWKKEVSRSSTTKPAR